MAAPRAVELVNGSFADWPVGAKVPTGWQFYGGGGAEQFLAPARPAFADGTALMLQDADPGREIGLSQDFAAEPEDTYEVRVQVAALPDCPAPSNVYLQLRFLPSNQLFQIDLRTTGTDKFEELAVYGKSPAGTKSARIYLYTHKGEGTTILLTDVRVRGGVELPKAPPGVPEMKAPQYTTLKDLHAATSLVTDGKAQAVIVAPACHAEAAQRLQEAMRTVTGVELPLVAEVPLPLAQHAVILGNRSTNPVLGRLYDLYYTLLDRKYPGVGGYALHSLHNPFGNGQNAILVGGSDEAGVILAADRLAEQIRQVGKPGALRLGYLLDVRLGAGLTVPDDIEQVQTWEASDGYGSVGYFGWNSISKRMALYYLTGDPKQAREVIRLAFPDAQAKEEIARIDGERIENKDDPLAGAYHYNQHMMTLFWDLIEESPAFSDAERLRVTNALARQLDHDDYARKGIYALRGPAGSVSSRHGQWAAVGLYCLGRYFQRDYPDPVWEHTFAAANYAFASLHRHDWVAGENDNLFWYSTGIAPVFTYLCLSGDRVPLENGVVAKLLRGQEALLNGESDDRQIHYASLGFLHKAAYLTGDGRWLYYRQHRTHQDTNIFRVGQSFWPGPELTAVEPTGLAGKWSIQALPEPLWQTRGSGIPLDQSFAFGSFRDRVDSAGDFVLLDGFNGASRNPYHTFAILDLRIAGKPLLRGYLNQVLTKADGMVEASVAMDAGLLARDVVGNSVYALGTVPRAAFCEWRRHLLQQVGQYALIVDELDFRQDSANMTVDTLWEPRGGRWQEKLGSVVYGQSGGALPGWLSFPALDATWQASEAEAVRPLASLGIVLLRSATPGSWMETSFELNEAAQGEVFLDTLKYRDRGAISVSLDGVLVAKEVNGYATDVVPAQVSLGQHALSAGSHTLRVQATGYTGDPEHCYAGIAALRIQPKGVPGGLAGQVFKLSWSDQTEVTTAGGAVTSQWRGPVRQGGKGVFFSLLAAGPAEQADACVRLDERRAFLRLPEPAIAEAATAGADLLVVSAHRLTARGLRRYQPEGATEPLVAVREPVALDWDFASGQLSLFSTTTNEITVAGQKVALTAGESRDISLPLPAASQAQIRQALVAAEATVLRLRQEQHGFQASALPAGLPTLPVAMRAEKLSGIADMVAITDGLAVAAGTSLRVFGLEGKVRWETATEGPIRVLHWWPEANLLLVGCRDEKVLAYDPTGALRWTFVSEMDPAVFRAAKTYWFKSAPGHEGIHGLYSGTFDGGEPRCFVGSACTLEVLDTKGGLVRRRPIFWGPGKLFAILPRPGGKNELLIARWPNGTDNLAVVNPDTFADRRDYYGVPGDQTMVGGWTAQNRVKLIVQDVDGDGSQELVSATNGRWNRVTVFANDGTPRANAQFGPAGGTQFREYLRDLAVGDLDGDGKAEILVAEWGGLVVALDHACQRLWSYRCPAPPRSLCLLDKQILVGCDDGGILALNPAGQPTGKAGVPGRIRWLVPLAGKQVAVATDAGTVTVVSPVQDHD